MHVRVVRFTDVSAERMDDLLTQIDDSGGAPQDVPIKGLQILVSDGVQGTAVVLQLFDSAEDMQAGSEVLRRGTASQMPGMRAPGWTCAR